MPYTVGRSGDALLGVVSSYCGLSFFDNSDDLRWGCLLAFLTELISAFISSRVISGHGDRYIGSLFRVDEPVPDDSLSPMILKLKC